MSMPVLLFVTSGNRMLDNILTRKLRDNGAHLNPVPASEAIAALTGALGNHPAKSPIAVVLYPLETNVRGRFRYKLSVVGSGHHSTTPEFDISGVITAASIEAIADKVMESFGGSSFSPLFREILCKAA